MVGLNDYKFMDEAQVTNLRQQGTVGLPLRTDDIDASGNRYRVEKYLNPNPVNTLVN